MRRQTPFDRDFADLHGRRPRATEFIRHEDIRAGRLVSTVAQPGLRLAFGALGLFWSLVLGGALLAMTVVGVAFIAGAVDPAQLGPNP